MELLLIGLGILLGGGALALVVSRAHRWSHAVGLISAVLGSLLALVPAVQTIGSGLTSARLDLPWRVPYGSFSLELDPLSAWFCVPILGLSALAAVYAGEYLLPYIGRKALGPLWFFYNVLVASMVLVVIARNGVLFLVAWEVMALSSYFLVVFEHEQERVREAGRTYLIASHLGTAFLLAFFVLLGREAGTLEFAQNRAWIGQSGGFAPGAAGVLFVLAVIGFGAKAGFMPLHVWLPEAHPAAPSHVSAVMSGVMIKTGIYGLVRALTFLGTPPQWWGWVLVAIGVASGVLGVLFALAQHNIKRLLAYSSVENIGIIVLGLGTGLLGIALDEPSVAILGFAGGLIHVLNHAVFKGLLFLGAGAVIHGTGTGQFDRQGGLLKRMPITGVTFLVGAVAISGLPPLNGFVSEFLIFLGAFEEELFSGPLGAAPALAIIGSLALIGGLAAACFTKALGVVFLGEPRTEAARQAHAAGMWMRLPMLALAALCFLIALGAVPIVATLVPVVSSISALPRGGIAAQFAEAANPLVSVVGVTAAVLIAGVVLSAVRKALLGAREVGASPTWDCGFAQPTVRMQYTASSFAQPLTDFFAPFLRTHKELVPPRGLFPTHASLHTQTPDVSMERFYIPVFRYIGRTLAKLSWIQHGRVNLYVLYIAATIVVLLVWYVL